MKQRQEQGRIYFRLAELLQERNMTRHQLGVETGLYFSTIQGMYCNTTTRISLQTLETLLKALNCELDELICYEKPSQSVTKKQ